MPPSTAPSFEIDLRTSSPLPHSATSHFEANLNQTPHIFVRTGQKEWARTICATAPKHQRAALRWAEIHSLPYYAPLRQTPEWPLLREHRGRSRKGEEGNHG